MGLESLLDKTNERRKADAQRYAEQDWDLCIICHAYGCDKRSLFIDCWYYIGEAVDEAMDITDCGIEDHKSGWYLRICKYCRGSFLAMLKSWAEKGRERRGALKTHDGALDYDSDESRNIPVRIHGATVMMTMEEYQEYSDRRGAQLTT